MTISQGNHVNRTFRLLRLISACAATAAACILTSSSLSAQPKSLTILHTNDIHASFLPHEAYWVKSDPKPMVGGFKELQVRVDSIRKAQPAVLLLDAGDIMTGNPITEHEFDGASGGALLAMMNLVGYDAWCPGNHDFDISQDNLIHLAAIARFPMLCANIVNDAGKYPVHNKPYAILERGGMKIGIIGVMSQELYDLVNQNNLTGIKVLSPAETVQKYIDRLKPETDLLIALTHEGVDEDSALAAQVNGLNIIVGGHSHTRLRKPRIVNGVTIVQAGSNCENLGVLEVSVENRRIIKESGSLLPLWARAQYPPNALTALVDSMKQVIDEEYSQVIATLDGDWIRKEGPSAIGEFITEAQREAAHAEVAFMNDHGIRRDVHAGPVTKRDLFEVLPFRNILVTFQLSGAQLRAVMLHDVADRPGIQVAGVDCRWKKREDGSAEIVSIEVQGKPLDDRRMYICAASDFFVGEAQKYLGIEIPKPIYLKQTMFEAVERQLLKMKTITPAMRYSIQRAP